MQPWWVIIFTIWYVVSLIYVGKRCWSGGLLIGVATCWGIIGGTWEHVKAYYSELDARPVEDRWMLVVFDGPIVLASSYMLIKFLFNTPASNLLKIFFLFLGAVLFASFIITTEAKQDLYWHIQHSMIHFVTALQFGVIAYYLDRDKAKKIN
ncbi:hypothetical protein LOD99_15315 [Oopsacas minuta]|uniref:Uncharacterized protein n=1 Tax=Oopsacas minuta TaxID=111878 RepID=A0AAV7KCA6_9METZ|nr:hypothetical protein LOD99_15315 [Oopsacas minuta]